MAGISVPRVRSIGTEEAVAVARINRGEEEAPGEEETGDAAAAEGEVGEEEPEANLPRNLTNSKFVNR